MLMSPATALARPLNQCPYCDHVSPANSKFCNECGAALHLKPCQHCGAVNDVTLTSVCARCNGALNEGTAVALVEAAPAQPQIPTGMPMTAVDSLPWQEARPALAASTSPSLRLLLVAALALGGLGLYAFQHKPAPPSPSAVSPAPAPAAVEAKAELTTPAIAAAPAAVPDRSVEPAETEASAAAVTAAITATVAADPPALGRPAAATRPAARPPRTSPAQRSDVEPPPPNIGPCTDAVAALGLCTPAPRRP
ncbi:zinc ribbon domain-containing protein [Roseateles cavernae]|uniref:zinc ribbon domain-containing protein n=1 Tax=Roseateles cavernae TaxID=3153578 RepID=UPI0032E51C34